MTVPDLVWTVSLEALADRTRRSWRRWAFAMVAAATPFTSASLAAQTTGTITGVITDQDGRQLNAVAVQVVGTARRTMTDVVGRYHLPDVPQGQHTLEVRWLGFQNDQVVVMVVAGQTTMHDLTLTARPLALEGLVITGQIGQAEAFNRQRTARSI